MRLSTDMPRRSANSAATSNSASATLKLPETYSNSARRMRSAPWSKANSRKRLAPPPASPGEAIRRNERGALALERLPRAMKRPQPDGTTHPHRGQLRDGEHSVVGHLKPRIAGRLLPGACPSCA